MANITEAIMADWAAKVEAYPDKVKAINAVYRFDVKDVGSWVLNCKDAPGVTKSNADAGCIIKLSEQTLAGINDKSINPQVAYMLGDVEILGDTFLALKLTGLVF